LDAFLTAPPDPHPVISMRIHGGSSAPFRARKSVLSQLTGQLAAAGAADLALVISELVTNSVCHANVGPRQTLTVECATLSDRLRVTVTDPGSHLVPHLRSPDHLASGGRGLRVVESLSSAWGVVRGPAGMTSVWCELPFDASSFHQPTGHHDDTT
jgi:anti-sigma regulatory factor (Ser/Thr protein kinase)